MDTQWWNDFFDRTYTDTWASAGMFDRTAEEVTGVVVLLGADHPLRILDAPCGFGRHSAVLHAMGHQVTGIDLSSDQLALARERNPGPTYVQADLRTPPPGPYDAVLNLFSSIGYFDDPAQDRAAIQAWHAVLRPGGTLLIETNHRDRLALIHQPGQVLPIGTDGAVEFGTMDWVTGIMHRTVRYADGNEREFAVRCYTATELTGMVRQTGFSQVEVFGDWQGLPISPETRLILRARR
ncbi:MAG: class I SAM-dependent methyltransferase [Euzebya sp.]